MGMTRTILLNGTNCTAEALKRVFAACGFPVQMRMIDTQLAFPDEVPPPEWHELRVNTPAGMITIQRQSDRIDLITWGNADAALLTVRDRLAEAFTQLWGATAAPQ